MLGYGLHDGFEVSQYTFSLSFYTTAISVLLMLTWQLKSSWFMSAANVQQFRKLHEEKILTVSFKNKDAWKESITVKGSKMKLMCEVEWLLICYWKRLYELIIPHHSQL